MTKREREALREYVEAVAAHGTWAAESFGTETMPEVKEMRVDTGKRLNAADDRLRALGMLR